MPPSPQDQVRATMMLAGARSALDEALASVEKILDVVTSSRFDELDADVRGASLFWIGYGLGDLLAASERACKLLSENLNVDVGFAAPPAQLISDPQQGLAEMHAELADARGRLHRAFERFYEQTVCDDSPLLSDSDLDALLGDDPDR